MEILKEQGSLLKWLALLGRLISGDAKRVQSITERSLQLVFISYLIIYMKKKILDSDWLIAVQFKCNTRAKSVAPVQKV